MAEVVAEPPAARDSEVVAHAAVAAPAAARPSLEMLADRPLSTDSYDAFGFSAYADALAELIDHPDTDTPLTIAISAPWGMGKTTLAKMVERRLRTWPRLRGEHPHIICWFNAWMHDDAPHLGAAFAADVAKVAAAHRPWWRKLVAPLPSAMLAPHERWRRRTWAGGFALLVALIVGPTIAGSQLKQSTFGLSVGGVIAVAFGLWQQLFSAARAAAHFIDEPGSEAARGAMDQVSAQLGRLIADAARPPRRLVIFVDDLDRCRPLPRAVEVCEIASQLLGHPGVVTVLVADMAAIAQSAEVKYAATEAPQADVGTGFGRFYLQKMVQIEFALPRARREEMRAMLTRRIEPEMAIRRRFGRVRSLIRWRVLATLFGAAVAITYSLVWLTNYIYSSDYYSSTADRTASVARIAGLVAIGAALVVTFVAVVKAVGSTVLWLGRRTRKRIEAEIARFSPDAVEAGDLENEVLHSSAAKGAQKELVRQLVHRHVVDNSALRREIEDSDLMDFLPQLPRSAKRALNHLRLRLAIATLRAMFGGVPPLTSRHFGKWVVLSERWPKLADALAQHCSAIEKLEAAASSHGDLSEALAELGCAELASNDLLQFLRLDLPLSGVLERLVYLQPAAASAASGDVVAGLEPVQQ